MRWKRWRGTAALVGARFCCVVVAVARIGPDLRAKMGTRCADASLGFWLGYGLWCWSTSDHIVYSSAVLVDWLYTTAFLVTCLVGIIAAITALRP